MTEMGFLKRLFIILYVLFVIIFGFVVIKGLYEYIYNENTGNVKIIKIGIER
ncbi:MAG: hypothetical protein QXH95_03405 [Thermoplasmata archaeon]